MPHPPDTTADQRGRQRLDHAMVARGLSPTRSRARDLIQRGAVTIDGQTAAKPGQQIGPAQCIRVDAEADRFASRAGLKLAAAMTLFAFEANGRLALDIGASTGGFTDALLQAGAARVHAVDVGHDQLAARLAADPRVIRHDGLDARRLTRDLLGADPQAIVADVSFISVTKALPAALAIAAPGCWLVALIKPQFEVGAAGIGKGGIVRDAGLRRSAVDSVLAWFGTRNGWRIVGTMESPVPGGSGNVEYLLGAVHDD